MSGRPRGPEDYIRMRVTDITSKISSRADLFTFLEQKSNPFDFSANRSSKVQSLYCQVYETHSSGEKECKSLSLKYVSYKDANTCPVEDFPATPIKELYEKIC